MLYVSRKVDNQYGVVDTEDCIEEFYTKDELRGIHKLGIEIKGITDTGIKIINWEQEPEYIKAKTLHYQLEITLDNKVKVVNKPDDMPIPNFCCPYDYDTDSDGSVTMVGTYQGENLVIPKFVNELEIDWGNHKKVTLSGGLGLVTLDYCFLGRNFEEIDLSNLDVSKVKNMGMMFSGCYKLQNLDSLRNWDVSNVKDMNGMFSDCGNLQNIDGLVNWNVSNVENMEYMFSNCKSLQNIDSLRNWNVSNVKGMYAMFYSCDKLPDIDALRNWDVSSVENMDAMFSNTDYWKVDKRGNRLVIK